MKPRFVELMLIMLVLCLIACGKRKVFISTHDNTAIQCVSNKNGNNINVSCPNGVNYSFPAPTDGINGVDGVNGTDGANGLNGINAQGIQIVDPCGDMVGQVDEILLVFPDNSVLAWYQAVGFVVLTPGVTYQTTDGQHCVFTVDANGAVND